MIIEQAGRRLIQIESAEEWEKLPKDIRGLPVYYRRTPTGVDLWPMWEDYMIDPELRVSP